MPINGGLEMKMIKEAVGKVFSFCKKMQLCIRLLDVLKNLGFKSNPLPTHQLLFHLLLNLKRSYKRKNLFNDLEVVAAVKQYFNKQELEF